MSNFAFNQMELSPEISRALDEMGFENATEIQFKAIPIIKQGHDVIGRSQTGTGKTIAFGIPSIETIDKKVKRSPQVLILCPTRELAAQAAQELSKLSKFKESVKIVDIYGGTSMERQIVKLKTANIVIGTPGRIMDHMRRKTLKLDNIKMVVLDEADEMLSMGFREDIEAILSDVPKERQTILFSATMPPEILSLTKKYQNNPQLVEVNKKQVTVSNIEQIYYNVPMGRKMDALNLILRFYNPSLAMIFCNTKKMVDDIAEYLHKHGFSVQGIHGDLKQSQRSKIMDSFKKGRTSILVATDVAARGIDVNGIDYVINYDVPQNTEYYVHRIGRTGRAGKSGKAITICSGRGQSELMKKLAKIVKTVIKEEEMPSLSDISAKKYERNLCKVKEYLKNDINPHYETMFETLVSEGFSEKQIVAAVLGMHFGKNEIHIDEIKSIKKQPNNAGSNGKFKKIVINIGRDKRVAPNHIVGAITESTNLCGKDIGKIEIFDNKTIVSIPENALESTISAMKGCKICGNPTSTKAHSGKSPFDNNFRPKKSRSISSKSNFSDKRRRKKLYNKF